MSGRAVALVEDDPNLALLVSEFFESQDVLVYRFTTVADALEFDGWAAMSLAVVDYLLPDGTGTDVLRHLEKIGFKGEKMLCTGYPIQGLQQDALRLSDAVVSKDSLWLQVLWTRWTDHG